MKRFSVVFICIFLCFFCFVGCGDQADEDGFFDQSTLNKNLIPDLPKIKSDGETSLKQGRFTFTTSEEEFVEYVESVYDYLVACSFEYFGYPTKVLATLFGGAPKCAFEYGNELSDFQTKIAFYHMSNKPEGVHYFFVWGNNGIDDEDSRILNARYLQIGFFPHEDYVSAYIELPYALMDYIFFLSAD